MKEAASCFADEFEYDDGQYLGTITSKLDLQRLFERSAKLLPPRSKMVVDYIATCPSGNIGTQWHVETDMAQQSHSLEVAHFTKLIDRVGL